MPSRPLRPAVEPLEDRCLPASLYVAPAGSDHNPGTSSEPLATIRHALALARPGDRVLLRSGTYHEKLVVPHGGSASGGFITLRAAPGAKPVLDGRGVFGASMILLSDVSWFRIAGLEIADDLGVNDGSGIRILGGGSHLELIGNTIHDIHGHSAMGITVYGTSAVPISNLLIEGNEIEHCDASDSEALTLNGNVTSFRVAWNRVHDVNNIGIDCIGGERDINPTQVARNGVVSHNTVWHAHSNYGGGYAAGIYVDGGRDIVIEDNRSYSNDLGIEVGAENPGVVASGITVRNNLIFGNDKGGLVFGGYDATRGRVKDCRFVNNVVYQNDRLDTGDGQVVVSYASGNVIAGNIIVAGSTGVLLSSDAGNVHNSFDANVWYSASGADNVSFTWNGSEYSTFADYRNGTKQDAHSRFANPRFVNAAKGDFHPAAGSPAIDAGSSRVGWFAPYDFDGNRRPQGGAPDAGAYEFVSPSRIR